MKALRLAPALLLVSCSLARQVAQSSFEKPGLAFQSAKLSAVDLNGADLAVTFRVTNPNSVGIDLARADYALQVEGHPVVSGRPANGLQIPGGGTADVTFPTHLVWQELAPALEALLSKDAVRYAAQGTLGLNTPLGVVSLPLSHQGTFEPPRLPQFDLSAPRLLSMSLLGARIAVPLKVGNRNAFPLPLGQVLGTVHIAGERVGTVAMPAPAPVAANGEQTLQLPLDISFLSAGAAVASAVKSGVALVRLEGSIEAAGAHIPVHLEKMVPIQRPGDAGQQ